MRRRKAVRRGATIVAVVVATGAPPGARSAPAQAVVEVRMAVAEAGLDPEWLRAISAYEDPERVARARTESHPLSGPEAEWADLVATRASRLPGRVADLSLPFGETPGPSRVVVLIGNSGGEDAFTPSDHLIAFDVRRLGEIYGAAGEPGNAERIDRFLDHEYTHLLHDAWEREHPMTLDTPLRRALWECLVEGIGNYRSLSPRWRGSDARPSGHARATLARLEPVFVERIAALARLRDGDPAEDDLTRDLSMGRFDRKWGALTVALWLLEEAEGDPMRLRPWIEAGPAGVLELARRHLPRALARELPAAS